MPEGPVSDDESNSWADSFEGSEDSGDDYYDQEDYDEETGSPDKEDGYGSEVDSPTKKPAERLVINTACTQYDVIRKTARKVCNFKVKEWDEDHEGAVKKGEGGQKLRPDWDLTWHDLSISPDFLSKMYPY